MKLTEEEITALSIVFGMENDIPPRIIYDFVLEYQKIGGFNYLKEFNLNGRFDGYLWHEYPPSDHKALDVVQASIKDAMVLKFYAAILEDWRERLGHPRILHSTVIADVNNIVKDLNNKIETIYETK